jgi:hypothetical protein
MDPQLEEIRRKKREEYRGAGAQRAMAAQQSKSSWSVFAAVGVVLVLGAVMYQQNIPTPADGQNLANAAAGVQVQGECPKPTGFGVCVEDCSNHDDCASQGKLCCSNGCGHVCMDPVAPGAAQGSSRDEKCTLMVSLAGEVTNEAEIKQLVPAPSNFNLLSSVKILILEYEAGRSQECCAAKRALEAKPEIAKSVEFDGAAPDCSSRGLGETDDTIEIVADGPEFIDPDEKEPAVLGGWSKPKGGLESNGLSDEHLTVWNQVVEKYPTHEEHDLKKLGKPISVKTQVVAGTNYKFGFENGAIVSVFHQPWTQTLEITSVKIPNGEM